MHRTIRSRAAQIPAICLLSISLGVQAAASGQAADGARDAFLAELTRVYAEADMALGRDTESVHDAVRRYIRESGFLSEYESRMARSFGPSCGRLGLGSLLESFVSQPDERRASYYLVTVQASCSRRMPEDRALLGGALAALERGKALRIERHEQWVEAERQLAVKEEAERRARAVAAREEARRAAEHEERERAERQRLAEAAAKEAAERESRERQAARMAELERERERLAAAAKGQARKSSGTPDNPVAQAAGLAGTFRCGLGEEHRVLYFGSEGEAVELISIGGTVLGYAGLYRIVGGRVLIRFVADNTWKVFAAKYEQRIADDFAWKRSAIASQKLMEFRVADPSAQVLRLQDARTKMLASGEVASVKRPDCARLDPSSAVSKALAAHARLAGRYVERDIDVPPEHFDGAMPSVGLQIESKKRKELEWFKRAPGILKMMATDRLLEELRGGSDKKCEQPRVALESAAAAAMGAINRIGDSELAKANPARAEDLAGDQLDPVFEEFLDSASRLQCLMGEASAVGL